MAGPHCVTDMMGRQITLPTRPQRIVSLVPSQTELLYDLGLEEEVVGITKFCLHPERWFRSKARVGGTKQVHPDRVAALRPDLIIANKEENVKEQVEALESIAPVWVSDISDLDDALVMIRSLGALLGRTEAAESIAAAIAGGFASLGRTARDRRVAYGIWRAPWMWAGGGTFIDDILRRCGWQNVLAGLPRYPALELDGLEALAPELVLLSSEPYPFREKHIAEVAAALPGAQVLLVDGEMFSWYGSRLQRAVPYLSALLSSAG